MDAVGLALVRLQVEEGFRALPYRDTEGHTTVGYGFNVEAGLSKDEAAALLAAQLASRQVVLLGLSWYSVLDPARQSVCLDIAFNDGLHGLLNFPHMIAALAAKDYTTAAKECKVTEPELAVRYEKLATILLTGAV
jgi:lysozyme